MILDFIERQVLGMKWLSDLVASALGAAGIDVQGRMGASTLFFAYDTLKITLLLVTLIFAVGYIQSYFPPERSRAILGRFHGLGANCLGALLGTVTPFCSCSSIPLFMGFTRAGLGVGVTFSFLISSPMVDLGSLVLLTSIFGARAALLYVAFGLAIAIAGGALIERLHMERHLEDFMKGPGPSAIEAPACPSQAERLAMAWSGTMWTFKKVFPYILCGVAIGAFIHNWIPRESVEAALGGGNPLGVVIATLVGIPMYADIFGTIPIAEALVAKGALPGVAVSFMMAVTTLSLPSLVLLRRAVKPPLLALFIAVCTAGIIAAGYLFNLAGPLLA